jgi:outer membrane protein assembly factor BamB
VIGSRAFGQRIGKSALIVACVAIALMGSVNASAADWPGFGFDAAHSGANPGETTISPGNVGQLKLAWSAQIGIDLRCTPVEANGVVYDTIGGGGGKPVTAYAYDLATGVLKWSTDYPNPPTTTPWDPGVSCIGGPAFGGGLLFVTDYYGFLGAIDVSNGVMKWSKHLGSMIVGAPTYSNGVLYVAERDAVVWALDASTGANHWQTTQFGSGAEVDSSPAVAGGVVVVGQRYACIDSKGVQTCGGIWAFDQGNGAVRWFAGGTGHSSVDFSSPAIAGDVVYVSIEDGGLDALALATGQRLWTGTIANVTGAQNWSTPAVAGGKVFVGGNDGKLYAFGVGGCGTASCPPIWTAALNGTIYADTKAVYASPAVANGLVYIVGDDIFQHGNVYAFPVNCTTPCSPLWKASLNYQAANVGAGDSSAIVANGTVLVNGYSVTGTSGSLPALLAYRLPLDHIGLSPASSSITAGGSQTYTATGYDAANNSLGDMTLGTTFTISAGGSCTGAICTATIAGAHTVTGTNSAKTATATLTVNAAAATQLALSGLTSAAAGTAQTATVTLRDSYGNLATGYQGNVHFTSSDAQATLPADYTFVAGDAGTHTFPVTLKTAGSQSVTAANYTAGSLTGSQTVTITAAAASRLELSGLVNAKSGTSQTAKVNLFDSFGNPATGYRGTVHFTSSDSQATLPANYTFTSADAGAHSFAVTLKTAGSQSATATDTANSSITGSQTVTITPAVDLDLRLSVNPSTATTGTTVTASASLTNTSSVTRSATLMATLRYVSAYGTFTFSTSTVTVTLAAGQTLAQSFPFTVDQNTPRGNYTVTVTATDVSGTVSATASLVVV